MYQNKFTNNFGGKLNKRPNSGRTKFGGRSNAGNGGNRFLGSRNGGNRNRSFESRIDVSMFIQKAEPMVKIEDAKVKNNFKDFDFNPILMDNIKNKGYLKPTPIQDEIIPHILQGRDVLGISNTGTGKTAAFLLPLINKILENPNKRILILSPTRDWLNKQNRKLDLSLLE